MHLNILYKNYNIRGRSHIMSVTEGEGGGKCRHFWRRLEQGLCKCWHHWQKCCKMNNKITLSNISLIFLMLVIYCICFSSRNVHRSVDLCVCKTAINCWLRPNGYSFSEVFFEILNMKGHSNCMITSKVTEILMTKNALLHTFYSCLQLQRLKVSEIAILAQKLSKILKQKK